MGLPWSDCSSAEADLARELADAALEYCRSEDELLEAVEDLGLYLAKQHSINYVGQDPRLRLWDAVLSLRDVDVAAAFPETEAGLSSNLISCFAHVLGASVGIHDNRGVVATPPILASDMASVAASYSIAGSSAMEPVEVMLLLSGEGERRSCDAVPLQQQLATKSWYDPCVGGGVFPVAILELLHSAGVPIDTSLLQRIRGNDLDPFGVQATRIRMAILATTWSSGISFTDAYAATKQSLRVGDSLVHFSEQRELGAMSGGAVDIVIGNPPYVRADKIPRDQKQLLRRSYPSVAGGRVDLYSYFIAHGVNALGDGGILCYVSPASFQKSKYGEGTRAFISRNGAVRALFDFDELPVFNGANVPHTSIYVFEKGGSGRDLDAHVYNELPQRTPLAVGLSNRFTIPQCNISPRGWQLHKYDVERILGLIAEESVSLLDYAGEIYSGVKTGCKRAFVLPASEARELASEQEFKRFLKPMLRPADARAWNSEWDGTHLLFIPKGEILPEGSPVLRHLRAHEKDLRSRVDTKGHPTWYGLRECSYCHTFEEPKIVFPDIGTSCRFSIDKQGLYIPDGAFAIPREDYLLLGLLNSCVGSFYFSVRCNSIGNSSSRGRLRFKKSYVKGFPIPRMTRDVGGKAERISKFARDLVEGKEGLEAITEIDELALDLYGIPVGDREVLRERSLAATSF